MVSKAFLLCSVLLTIFLLKVGARDLAQTSTSKELPKEKHGEETRHQGNMNDRPNGNSDGEQYREADMYYAGPYGGTGAYSNPYGPRNSYPSRPGSYVPYGPGNTYSGPDSYVPYGPGNTDSGPDSYVPYGPGNTYPGPGSYVPYPPVYGARRYGQTTFERDAKVNGEGFGEMPFHSMTESRFKGRYNEGSSLNNGYGGRYPNNEFGGFHP